MTASKNTNLRRNPKRFAQQFLQSAVRAETIALDKAQYQAVGFSTALVFNRRHVIVVPVILQRHTAI